MELFIVIQIFMNMHHEWDQRQIIDGLNTGLLTN